METMKFIKKDVHGGQKAKMLNILVYKDAMKEAKKYFIK